MNPTDDQLHTLSEYQLRSRAQRLLRNLYNKPPAPRKKVLKKIREAIARKLDRPGIKLDR